MHRWTRPPFWRAREMSTYVRPPVDKAAHYQLRGVKGFFCVLTAAGEDFKGCLVPLLGGLLKDTEKGFVDFNQGLKRAAEAKK